MANEPRVVFRADASAAVGGGHAWRCLTLADALAVRGAACAFACRPGSDALVPGLARYPLLELDGGDATVPGQLAARWPGGVDWLVVDHYGLDARFERACRPWARRVLAIDDLADRPHDAELLLDQAHGRAAAAYAGWVAPSCVLLLGSDYALLRPAFAARRPEALARRDGRLGRVLVALGAADPDNHAGLMLEVLRRADLRAAVTVVLGPQPRHLEAVATQARACPFPVEVLGGVDDMAALMAAADLAIGAGGASAWERCSLGLPTALLIAADNQLDNARALLACGAARLLGDTRCFDIDAAASRLAGLAADAAGLRAMAHAGAALCDGGGAPRVAERMLEEMCAC